MRILEITAFSSGFCGLWARVEKESELLAKSGHEVFVLSSNIHRGSGNLEYASLFEQRKNFSIFRFKPFTKFGENTYFWNFFKKAIKIKPEIIICHAYRQYYSTLALKVAKKLDIPCFLVTHAPFLEKKLGNWKTNSAKFLYDFLIGKKTLNNYSKIFTITKWEVPYLLKLGAEKSKIIYSPNGIPQEFFTKKIKSQKNKLNKILFLGRISPIKDIITLVRAFKICSEKNKNIQLILIGPIEQQYGLDLKRLIKKLNLEKQILFKGPVSDLNKKIKLIDDADVCVLPSKREGMPQSLIEMMARKKIVIASKIPASEELISEAKNGYLFEQGNAKDLSEKILFCFRNFSQLNKIRENAYRSVKKFKWEIIISKILKILRETELQQSL